MFCFDERQYMDVQVEDVVIVYKVGDNARDEVVREV